MKYAGLAVSLHTIPALLNLLMPREYKEAWRNATTIVDNINTGAAVHFVPPVPAGAVGYMLFDGQVISRSVKAYRVRPGGQVYADLYSPPNGVIYSINDVYPTYNAAMAALIASGERKAREDRYREEGLANNLAADGTALDAKADRVANWIMEKFKESINEYHGIGFAITPQFYPGDENHQIFRDPALKTAVLQRLSMNQDMVIKDNGQDIIQFEKKGAHGNEQITTSCL